MKRKIYCLAFAFLALLPASRAQNKTVTYTTTTRTSFSVPTPTEFQKLYPLDFARMESKERVERVRKEVQDGVSLRIVREDLSEMEFLSDSLYAVARSESSAEGIRLYDFYDKLVHFQPFDSAYQQEPYVLDLEEYEGFGFVSLPSPDDIPLILEVLTQAGFTVEYPYQDNDLAFRAFNDSKEVLLDLESLLFETSTFQQGELASKHSILYLREEEVTTPFLEVMRTYYLSTGNIPVTRIESTAYLEYAVEENGQVIYQRAIGQQDAKPRGVAVSQEEAPAARERYLKVYPNPATDQITVELPAGTGGKAFLEILDLKGSPAARKKNASKSPMTLDISHLEAGAYILRCVEGKSIQSVKFLKQ